MTLRYKPRHRARIKFLVDDYGIKMLRELIEAKMGKRLDDYNNIPKPKYFDDHMGIREQSNGLYII